MAVEMFASIYIGSYEVSLKIFEISQKKGMREVEHIRAACRSVYREKAQTCGRNVIKFAIAVRQQFVRFFGSGV